MIGYVGVEQRVDRDFDRALLKASLRRLKDWLRRDRAYDRLLSFDEAKGALARWSQAYRGIRTVEVEKITGSVGRYRDFDSSFLPLKVGMGDRWGRVDRAYHRGVELPAVSLYKIGEAYFVRDGNHRVSVARYHGVATVDAEVVEVLGRRRNDAAQRTEPSAADQSLLPPEPRSSRLRCLLRRLRPGQLKRVLEPSHGRGGACCSSSPRP